MRSPRYSSWIGCADSSADAPRSPNSEASAAARPSRCSVSPLPTATLVRTAAAVPTPAVCYAWRPSPRFATSHPPRPATSVSLPLASRIGSPSSPSCAGYPACSTPSSAQTASGRPSRPPDTWRPPRETAADQRPAVREERTSIAVGHHFSPTIRLTNDAEAAETRDPGGTASDEPAGPRGVGERHGPASPIGFPAAVCALPAALVELEICRSLSYRCKTQV